MLQKRLYIRITCCTLLYALNACTTERDISTTAPLDTVTLTNEYSKTPDLVENAKSHAHDDEGDFLDTYEKQPPSKTDKLLLFVAPYIMKLLPCYLYIHARIKSMKLCAARCYTKLMHHAS